MTEEQVWGQLPKWQAVERAADGLLQIIDNGGDGFQAGLVALRTALGESDIDGEKLCNDFDSIPPGSPQEEYRTTLEEAKRIAILSQWLFRRAALWPAPACPIGSKGM
jgi:hypothetical protein